MTARTLTRTRVRRVSNWLSLAWQNLHDPQMPSRQLPLTKVNKGWLVMLWGWHSS